MIVIQTIFEFYTLLLTYDNHKLFTIDHLLMKNIEMNMGH
jgi:hypothetical protein